MDILDKRNILTGLAPEPHEDVIRRCGRILADSGYVNERYIEGMLARDRSFSTAIGNLVAIPHGELAYKSEILRTGLVVLTYPEGLDWNGQTVKLVVGIAAKADEHLEILERIAEALEDERDVEELVRSADTNAIYNIFVAEEKS